MTLSRKDHPAVAGSPTKGKPEAAASATPAAPALCPAADTVPPVRGCALRPSTVHCGPMCQGAPVITRGR